MSGQLTAIQGLVEDLKKQGVQVTGYAGPVSTSGVSSAGVDDEDAAPLFIPSVKRDDVEANITVEATESKTSVGDAKAALKALKKKNKK